MTLQEFQTKSKINNLEIIKGIVEFDRKTSKLHKQIDQVKREKETDGFDDLCKELDI